MDSGAGIALLEPFPRMDIFLAAFDDIPDPRAGNARHDLCELLVAGFAAGLCGAASCADMASEAEDTPQRPAEVVSLDKFRKQ